MPIRPERRALYPRLWPFFSSWLRFMRAGGLCEFCQEAEHGKPHPRTGSMVVLTVAHLDHDETHMREEDCAAMCQLCHNTYDAPHRRGNSAATRRRRLGNLELFEIPAAAQLGLAL